MENKHFPLFLEKKIFFDEKSSFDSLISVIDPCGDIWLGPFNLHYCSTLDSFNTNYIIL
jgi:hypothetical protein